MICYLLNKVQILRNYCLGDKKMSYIEDLEDTLNVKRTENGALTLESSKSNLVDFFGLAGSYRGRDKTDLKQLFQRAYNENANYALRILFYVRDIREGQGERETFRTVLKYIADNGMIPRNKSKELFEFVVEYGRWDDLYVLVDSIYEELMFNYMHMQLKEDLEKPFPSLMAKWLKSENASAKQTKELGKKTRVAFDLTSKSYRLILSKLRSKIKIVETLLTKKNYSEIDYEKIPSKAMLRYTKAFYRNDEEGFKKYLDSVNKGEKKINFTS